MADVVHVGRLHNTNGNGSASVTAIAPGTNAQTLNIASATGVPGQNSTAFKRQPATSLPTFGRNRQQVGSRRELRARAGNQARGGAQLYAASGPTNAVSGNSLGHPVRHGPAFQSKT